MLCKVPGRCKIEYLLIKTIIMFILFIPRVNFRYGDALVLPELRLQQEPVEEVDQGDGVLLGGEYRDHQV